MVSAEDGRVIRLVVPEIGDEEIQAVVAVLRSGHLVQGEYVQEFERQVAEYVGVKHAMAVSSGTAALHLGLLSLGIDRTRLYLPRYSQCSRTGRS
jgi:perosamine synthetase